MTESRARSDPAYGGPLRDRLLAPVRGLGGVLVGERDRWVLWIPVLLAAGIGAYFAWPAEPPLWLGASGLAGAALFGFIVRRHLGPSLVMIALGLVAGGFAAAQWRTALVSSPMLEKRQGPMRIEGRVVALEAFPKSTRVTLDRLRIARLRADRTPEKVRLRLRGAQPEMAPGDWIRVLGVLSPPPPPAAPGAFDFQRRAYFQGLGGVGFGLGAAERIAGAGDEGLDALKLGLQRLRRHIGARVLGALGGREGGIAVALMTGDRSAIAEPLLEDIRESGLAHLLAISGLHIGLVAAILFFGLRGVLALLPPVALRFPIKKWAAAAAIPGALAYALVAGATVPSQRAFLMIALVLAAVLFDRRGLSMRMVAWAATIVLVLSPESLLGASFQLSFAAVTALVAVYEVVGERRRPTRDRARGWFRTAALYVAGVALTTGTAGLATAPFVAYHFNRLADYGLAANLVAVPVTALWVMPWAVAAFALLPLGLEGLALAPMAWGIAVVIDVAETVAAWPGAVTMLPAVPAWGLLATALGGLWLCLWRRRWRWLGGAGIAAGLVAGALVRPPDILIDGGAKVFAVRTAGGLLAISSKRAARLERATWLRRAGLREAAPWPKEGPSADGRLACDLLGCIYRAGGRVVALVKRPEALFEDCRVADVVVSAVPVRGPCPSATTVIDRFDLWREGGHALWLEGPEVTVKSVNALRGRRPWVIGPTRHGL